MIKAATAFLFGCLFCFFSSPQYLTAIVAGAALLLLWAIPHKSLPIISFCLAILWANLHIHNLWQNQLSSQHSLDKIITGTIASIPAQQQDVLRFIFQPDEAALPRYIRVSWYLPPSKRLPAAGETWQLSLRLKAPRGFKNPGVFDYEKWLFANHIGATAYVRSDKDSHYLQAPSALSLNHWRDNIRQQLQGLAADTQFLPLIEGLTIGYRANMSEQHWQVLRLTGTIHLLAISGLHISLAAAVGFFLWRWLWGLSSRLTLCLPAQRAAAIAGLCAALCYALLAGLSIPTQRALIMVTTVMLALWLNRPVYASQVIALSLIAVLIFDPSAVLTIGFWLSFTATLLIILLLLQRFPPSKYQALTIHFYIALGLSPLLLLFFGQTTLIAPIANIIAVPMVSIVIVPLLLMASAVMSISASLASALFSLADNCLALLWQWLSWLASFTATQWSLPNMPLWLCLLSFTATLLVLLPRGIPARYWGILILPILLLYQPPRPPLGSFRLSVLDVGQGSALVIETKQHQLVYDTGAAINARFDMGQRVVVPFLHARAIKQLDALVISHSDNDHSGGTQSVLQALPVKKIISSDPYLTPHTQRCQAGQQWQWDEVHFEFLHPHKITGLSPNNSSCVLKITGQYYSALLLGDIEKSIERQLVKQHADKLPSDVLIVAHHGSRSSSSPVFIDAVSPTYAVFSVGFNNRYNFPATSVLQRYQQRAITPLRTDWHGAILFDPYGIPLLWRQHSHWVWSSNTTE